MTPEARARVRLGAPLFAVSAAAWLVLAIEPVGMSWPTACAAGSTSLGAPLDLALVLNAPATLAGGWMLMWAAMMLPLLAGPVRFVWGRSFARRRWRAVALFVVGYATCWAAAGLGLVGVALAGRLAGQQLTILGVVTVLAIVWQASPLKQRCLNRCHAEATLAAFGWQADRDAFRFGLEHGVWCVGTCWALMLLVLVLPTGHLAAMGAVGLWLFVERLDRPTPPGWRWRGPGKVLRLVAAQATTVPSRLKERWP